MTEGPENPQLIVIRAKCLSWPAVEWTLESYLRTLLGDPGNTF